MRLAQLGRPVTTGSSHSVCARNAALNSKPVEGCRTPSLPPSLPPCLPPSCRTTSSDTALAQCARVRTSSACTGISGTQAALVVLTLHAHRVLHYCTRGRALPASSQHIAGEHRQGSTWQEPHPPHLHSCSSASVLELPHGVARWGPCIPPSSTCLHPTQSTPHPTPKTACLSAQGRWRQPVLQHSR
jgi:hypothetical protein